MALRDRLRAGRLNAPVTLAEVAAVFGKLGRGKAAGPDGIRGELLRDAVVKAPGSGDQEGHDSPRAAGPVVYSNVLLPVVHAIVNAVFVSGRYPAAWSCAAVSAVFKKGDPQLHTNYRGIALDYYAKKHDLFNFLVRKHIQ